MKNNSNISSNEDTWIQSHWRPAMAITYMLVIMFDFVVGPIFWTILQLIGNGSIDVQWMPLTLGGGGLFHVSMAGIIGASAYTRGQEKIERLKIDAENMEIEDAEGSG